MNDKLYKMLKSSAEADLAKADLTMDLLSNKAAGIGDHSTGDFYKNAEEALSMAADAVDRLEVLERYCVVRAPDDGSVAEGECKGRAK